MRIILSVVLLFALSLFALFAVRSMQPGAARTEAVSVPMTTGGVALQLTFGLKDAEPADWSGRLKLSAGGLDRLEGRLQANDRIEGDSWQLRSRRQGQGANARVNQGKFDTLVTKGNGDQVRLLKFDGGQWSGAWNVSGAGLDVWRPAVAADAQGGVRVIWSQSVQGNWDLHAARFDPKSNRAIAARCLTSEAGADINPVAVAAGRNLYVAWQGWRGGNFDIWLAGLT